MPTKINGTQPQMKFINYRPLGKIFFVVDKGAF